MKKKERLIHFRAKYILILTICMLGACDSPKERIKSSLENAGDNREELLKVIDHYKNDSLKLEAAIFLLQNMQFHLNNDQAKNVLQEIYDKHFEISNKYNWDKESIEWQKEIDSLENSYSDLILKYKLSTPSSDVRVIKADWLIKQIDLAFNSWKSNIYTKELPFDIFCEFILPYRFKDGIILDDSKSIYHQRHHELFKDSSNLSFIQKADSLLRIYDDIKFSNYVGYKIPMNSAKALEQIKYGLCDDRSWFNSFILSSVGIASCTDFAPAQGNRNSAHTWNAIIDKGGTIPFEPFGDEDRWKYKIMYNNKTTDRKWGKLRFAKVFRNTFSINKTGPLFDPEELKDNIPSTFRNPKMKDVSHEYFDTTNVTIKIPAQIKKCPAYAYLCVYNKQQWSPIQWGKISDREATFTGMGRDVVYLPTFYINGDIHPIGEPFYLSPSGEISRFTVSAKTQDIYMRSPGNFRDPLVRLQIINNLSNAIFLGVNEKENRIDTLHTVSDYADLWENRIHINSKQKYDFIDIQMPTDTFAFCDLSFFTSNADKLELIRELKIQTPITLIHDDESINMLTDHISSTGMIGKIKIDRQGKYKVRIDLSGLYTISAIEYVPYTPSLVNSGYTYTLYYWDQGWQLFGEKKGNDNVILFNEVPSGTIYRLNNETSSDQNRIQRIFSYKNGHVKWL